MSGLNILPDGNDQGGAGDEKIVFSSWTDTRTTIFDLADHLRGDIQSLKMTVRICLDPGRCF